MLICSAPSTGLSAATASRRIRSAWACFPAPARDIACSLAAWSRVWLCTSGSGGSSVPPNTTDSALSLSSFPSSSSATVYRPAGSSKDSTRARLPLYSGLETRPCSATRLPVGSLLVLYAAVYPGIATY